MMAAYVEGGDSAGRVAGDELHLDAELAEEVLARGVEASARTLVEDERRHLPAGTVVVCADVAVRGELVEPELRGGGPDEEAEDGDSERRRDQSQCRRRPRHSCTLMVCVASARSAGLGRLLRNDEPDQTPVVGSISAVDLVQPSTGFVVWQRPLVPLVVAHRTPRKLRFP
jgi:hypothetical protein